MIAIVRAMLLLIAPWHWTPHHGWTYTIDDATKARVIERARAIYAASVVDAGGAWYPRLAAELLVVDFYETTYGHAGVPFGACAHLCRHHCGQCRTEPLADTAAWAAGILMHAETECGLSIATVLGYYHSGTCRADDFSRTEAEAVRRFERELLR